MAGLEISIQGCGNLDVECDNPISLDEIEQNLWLGMFCYIRRRRGAAN